MGKKSGDASCSLVLTESDQLLPPCVCGGSCLCSGLCPQRPTSSSSTAFPMSPLTISITFTATYGKGSVSPTKTMPHSKVGWRSMTVCDWGAHITGSYVISSLPVLHPVLFLTVLRHWSVVVKTDSLFSCWWEQFLPETFGQVFLRTTSACCISGTVAWASAVSLETAGSPTTSQVSPPVPYSWAEQTGNIQ